MNHPPTPAPPRLARRLLRWRCPADQLEELEGDLEELFADWVRQSGLARARYRYWFHVLGFLRPVPFRQPAARPYFQPLYRHTLTPFDMLRNYWNIARRNLLKHKASSLINLLGLSTGMACCLLIGLFIRAETRYDRQWQDHEQLYRVANEVYFGDQRTPSALLAAPVAAALGREFPEVEATARLLVPPEVDKHTLQRLEGGRNFTPFSETKGYMVDSSFFRIFNYPFVHGDARAALAEPNTVVLSAVLSRKLFGAGNPVGKVVRISNKYGKTDYRVTGVFEPGGPSHIDANFFTALPSGAFGRSVSSQTNWAVNTLFHTYVKLRPGASPQALEAKLPAFLQRHGGADLAAAGLRRVLFLQPVASIHLESALYGEIGVNGSVTYLYVLASIAAFTLLLACINFMNLSTARATRRAREVGIRKVMGGEKGALVVQFLGESVLMSLLSLVLAVGLAALALPAFSELVGQPLTFSPARDFSLVGWLLGLAVVTGLLAGSYPAFYLSSFQPVGVLKGKFVSSIPAVRFRRGLVVFQFVIFIGLVLSTLVIHKQMRYLTSQPLGFAQHQQLVIPLPTEEAQASYPIYKQTIEQLPGVVAASGGATYPGQPAMVSIPLRIPGKHVKEARHVTLNAVDVGFTENLGFTLVAGRSFSARIPADTSRSQPAIVLNETAVRALGYTPEAAIGKPLLFDLGSQTQPYRVIGVVKDFHFQSLHQPITPYGFVRQGSPFAAPPAYLVARVDVARLPSLLASLEKHWQQINPAAPFAYSFLDQDFQRNYQAERRVFGMVGYFTGIAILIACLGLYGLMAYTVEQRTREIGIRKILGASGSGLTMLLAGDFLKLVLVANVIAWPLGWWLMDRWLQAFAYRVSISWWLYVLAGGVALLIALLTVGAQAIRASLTNPVKSLRAE